jgi:hypothetical protein
MDSRGGARDQPRQKTTGQPLAVHIGPHGLAVTGKFDFAKPSHQIAGDTVNVASRLCTLAQSGETLVGQATYKQAEAFFSFGRMELVQVKGKTKPVQAYRLLAPRELPNKSRLLSGRRAALIGRQREMAVLAQAMARLEEGQGSNIAIGGEAGTGKSRLLEEFQATLDLKAVKWMEGHAYAYTQNISYYPLINMIKRELALGKGDTPGKVAARLDAYLEGPSVAGKRGPVYRWPIVRAISRSGGDEPRVLEVPPPSGDFDNHRSLGETSPSGHLF